MTFHFMPSHLEKLICLWDWTLATQPGPDLSPPATLHHPAREFRGCHGFPLGGGGTPCASVSSARQADECPFVSCGIRFLGVVVEP